jgi:hypothetical protein
MPVQQNDSPEQYTEPSFFQRRRRYFVDPEVQGALVLQAVGDWLCAAGTFAMVIFIFRVVPTLLSGTGNESPGLWYHFGPYVLASAVLLPIVTFNSVRFSNRFAGPMVRVRRTLKQLANGESPPNIALRHRDFWCEIGDDINEINQRLRQASSSSISAEAESEGLQDVLRFRRPVL